MELLDERWTLLVVRELLMGSRHFNELRRGVPRMSPALLSKRLRTLMRAGLVDRFTDGNRVTYVLTPAGEELHPIVESVGRWGTRWITQLGDADLDPHLLLWDMHRNLELAAFPDGRTVLRFTFPDVPPAAATWWIVVTRDEVDLCDTDPGHSVDVAVTTGLRALTEVWRGDRRFDEVLRSGELLVEGPAPLRRALPRWLKLSAFAAVPRPV
ncbi:MAG: helix-turn-helix transcriptional regulator [Actinobacteria bacterium]|nr:helix-turn-helix transcriptional regulator [Actinomycetota bacterium]